MTLLIGRMEINIAPDDNTYFNDVIRVSPQWRLTVIVTLKYQINLDAPVAKWKMYYATVTPTATNYVLTECSHKKL